MQVLIRRKTLLELSLGLIPTTSNFGLNIKDLRMELLLVKATLEQAARKDICGTAMEELLRRLLDLARNAEDLLDELDYFRIHDELYGTYDAADQHVGLGVRFNRTDRFGFSDLEPWEGSCDLPRDMSNLAKLCHIHTPSDGELHSGIYNVGKLKLLEELKVFRVNKKSEGFEPKQLEHLSKLMELGIYNLEKIHTEEEAAQAKLIEKNHLRRLTQLTLIGLGGFEKWVYTREQESSMGGEFLPPDSHMFPLLQVLIIRECPRLLGLPFPNHIVSPDWFPKLQELRVTDCPEFSSVVLISWIESLRCVVMKNVELPAHFWYLKSSNSAHLEIIGKADLHRIDQVLVFDKETGLKTLKLEKCPSLELKHLLMLTSLKILIVKSSVGLVGPLGGGQSDVEWQLPVEHMHIKDLNGNTGEELTELLCHLPNLSKLNIQSCKNIKKLVVGVDVQQTTLEASDMGEGEITAAAEEDDDGVLLFPPHLCDSL
ncbi:Disease resistance protein RGA2 [Hordeum vulgare]|nr:Disease resistance protein RGA2 [Hordeum vulgare]